MISAGVVLFSGLAVLVGLGIPRVRRRISASSARHAGCAGVLLTVQGALQLGFSPDPVPDTLELVFTLLLLLVILSWWRSSVRLRLGRGGAA